MKWKTVKLKDICEIQPHKKKVKDIITNDSQVSFMGMNLLGINQVYAKPKEVKTLSAVYSAYTYFSENDVLLAKITPCFENGKLGIAQGLKNGIGFGSSEFIVFRCKEDLLPKYLYYFLNQKSFREKGKNNMSGAVGHKRVDKNFIENTSIFLPPIFEQQRIIAKIDAIFTKIDKLILISKQKKTELEKYYLSAVDNELFSDTSTNIVSLKEVASVKGGKRIPRGKKLINTPTKFPYIRVTDFNNKGSVDEDSVKYISKDIQKKISRYTISTKDVYVSIAGTIGKTGVIPDSLNNANLTENAAKIVLDEKCLRDYFYQFTTSKSFAEQALQQTHTAAQPKLALKRLSEVKFPLPSIAIQKIKIDKIKTIQEYKNSFINITQKKIEYYKNLKFRFLFEKFNEVIV